MFPGCKALHVSLDRTTWAPKSMQNNGVLFVSLFLSLFLPLRDLFNEFGALASPCF